MLILLIPSENKSFYIHIFFTVFDFHIQMLPNVPLTHV